MALIVEDGSMVEGANTYADMERVESYLSGRGAREWSALEEKMKISLIIRAADVLNSYRWKGVVAQAGRLMAWPREGSIVDEVEVPHTIVPQAIIVAQCEIAGALAKGFDPLAQVDTKTGPVIAERVEGAVSVSYGSPSESSYTGSTGLPMVDGLLRPYLRQMGTRFGIIEAGRG